MNELRSHLRKDADGIGGFLRRAYRKALAEPAPSIDDLVTKLRNIELRGDQEVAP